MAGHARGLGKGLGALLGNTSDQTGSEEQIKSLNLVSIYPNPNQPRQHFSDEALEELAQSIRSRGVLQPILVRPGSESGRYELIAGERRLRASQIAGLSHIPAIIREISDKESFAIALIENLQREDLNPLEEALALNSLKQELDLSQEELSAQVGKSRSAVANSLRWLQLPDSIQADLRNGLVSSGHARAILSISDPAAQEELALLIKRNGLNVRQTEALASSWKKGGTFGSRRKTQQPKPASFFHSIKSHLSKRLSCRVQMSGTKDKGAITLKYRNAEEFEKLLEQLGLPDEVSGERK